jgi:hypothetical protein
MPGYGATDSIKPVKGLTFNENGTLATIQYDYENAPGETEEANEVVASANIEAVS